MKRLVLRVKPTSEGWVIAGPWRGLTYRHPTQRAAIRDGVKACHIYLGYGNLAQLVVHGRDGRIWITVRTFVDQRQRHDPANGEVGDCYRACLATMTGLELDEVPHFYEPCYDREGNCTDEQLRDAGLRVRACLAERGWHFMGWPYSPSLAPETAPMLCILSGMSPRGPWEHAVIAEVSHDGAWRIVHDPHPSRAGIVGDPTTIEILFPLMRAAA